MKTKLITLKNSFHGSEVNLRPLVLPDGQLELTAGQVRRARRVLCGIATCTCGGTLGDRPHTDILYEYEDGSVRIPDYDYWHWRQVEDDAALYPPTK